MKKSFKYLFVITLVFSLSSCSKNEPIQKMSNNEKIQLATLSIIQDNNFLNFLNIIKEQSLMINETNNTIIDFEMFNNKIAKSIVIFILHNPYYNDLNINEKKQVLENILGSEKNILLLLNNIVLSDKVTRLNNNFNTNKIITHGFTNKSFKVTNEEVVDCLINTAFSILFTYGKELTDIGILLRGGAPMSLGFEIGVDLIKKASPWWTVAALVGQFSYCLYEKSQN